MSYEIGVGYIVVDKEASKLGRIFDKHLEFEDVDATMTTMTEDPYVHHVPTLTGGRGYNGVHNFYKKHFIGKMQSSSN